MDVDSGASGLGPSGSREVGGDEDDMVEEVVDEAGVRGQLCVVMETATLTGE